MTVAARLQRWTAVGSDRLVQRVLAPGAERFLDRQLRTALAGPTSAPLLDVGAGSCSRLAHAGVRPVAVDTSLSRVAAAHRAGALGVGADAVALPFRDGAFGVAVSVGLLHHLPDAAARRAVGELIRVARPDGRVLVFDAVRPRHAWRRPLAWLIRRLDRGRFMRDQPALGRLLGGAAEWSQERLAYAWTGLEGVLAVRRAR